jgi:hypothetical protein
MRADICSAGDETAISRFIQVLHRRGAHAITEWWAMGVDVCCLEVGDQVLTVFSDTWSLDIDGPDDLVQQVLVEYGQPETP